MLVHVWESSCDSYRLMRCNCSTVFPEVPHGDHSDGRCGIDIRRVNRLGGVRLSQAAASTPYMTAQSRYPYVMYPQAPTYAPSLKHTLLPRFTQPMRCRTHRSTQLAQMGCLSIVGTEKRREKVVILRELQRAIIYTRELSKQAIEDHVSTAFTVYSVNDGARLTSMCEVGQY
jgi:hypothetical protein